MVGRRRRRWWIEYYMRYGDGGKREITGGENGSAAFSRCCAVWRTRRRWPSSWRRCRWRSRWRPWTGWPCPGTWPARSPCPSSGTPGWSGRGRSWWERRKWSSPPATWTDPSAAPYLRPGLWRQNKKQTNIGLFDCVRPPLPKSAIVNTSIKYTGP